MATSTPSPDHIVLVGMMGAGKSSVGRRLADLLDRPFIDVDSWLEDEEGASVATLFATRGEPGFRDLEAQALPSFLAAPGPCVVSVGGGAVTDERSRQLLGDENQVVWLRARPDTLHARIGDGSDRPLLEGRDVAATLERLTAERERFYQEVADTIVDIDGLTVDEVVELIMKAVA